MFTLTDDEKKPGLGQIGAFVTLPFVMSIPPIIGWLIGHYLDKKFNTTPYLSYLFLILGVAAGAIEFYRIIKKYGKS